MNPIARMQKSSWVLSVENENKPFNQVSVMDFPVFILPIIGQTLETVLMPCLICEGPTAFSFQ
jgi:hypothetical protein